MTESNRTLFFDGQKAVALKDLPDSAWDYLVGGPLESQGMQALFQQIPWFFRGVHLRANALANVPFAIMRGETEVDTSADYQSVLKWLPDPKRMLYLTEASLTIAGAAYHFKENNAFLTKGLRYMVPTTVKEKYSDTEGLTGFKRKVGSEWKDFEVEDFLYHWLPDPYKELGPGTAPGIAALKAAGVLLNMDTFIEGFFKRGAIKASILGIKGNPPEPEKKRLRDWFKRTLQGVDNAWGTEVTNADAIQVQQIGEGIKELENSELTKEKREDIAVAFGIPPAVLFSEAANFATAVQDKKNLYEDTVLPEADWIQNDLNSQLFEALGLRFLFRPQEMPIFQEDEAKRAQSFAWLVQGGFHKLTALEVLGFELSDESMAREMQEPEPQPIPVEAGNVFDRPDVSLGRRSVVVPDTLRSDLDKWHRKSLKALKAGKSAAVAFESDLIPAGLAGALSGSLETAGTVDEVNSIFSDRWLGYP